MGLELFILAFLVGFFTLGIAAPVLAWAGWTELRRRKLKSGLLRLGATYVEDLGGPSADAPVRLSLHVGEQLVRVAAVVRGGEPLWHLTLSVERATVSAPFALVDRRWARPLPAARRMRPLGRPAARGEDGLELRVKGDDDGFLERHLAEAVASLGGRPGRLLQCVLDNDELTFEVAREGLSEHDLLPWIERMLLFADALGVRGAAPPPILRLSSGEGRIIGSVSGNPVGLPG